VLRTPLAAGIKSLATGADRRSVTSEQLGLGKRNPCDTFGSRRNRVAVAAGEFFALVMLIKRRRAFQLRSRVLTFDSRVDMAPQCGASMRAF
jgi:hypothetical protein